MSKEHKSQLESRMEELRLKAISALWVNDSATYEALIDELDTLQSKTTN